ARETAVWQALAAKEHLCEELDRMLCSRQGAADAAVTAERWAALPALPTAWEKAMLARRNAALAALADDVAAAAHVSGIERDAEARREMLLELEMLLGLDSPAELSAQRLALQVKKLRDRFQSAAATGNNTAGDLLLAWCARPGVVDARDRQRSERVFSAAAQAR
ncbi:MAG: hypothetical protein ABI624_21750, partial [Casimicrobiaceae bacterium]